MADAVESYRPRHRTRPEPKPLPPNAVQSAFNTSPPRPANAIQSAFPTSTPYDLCTVYRAPSELKFASRSARRHPRKQLEQLKASQCRFGFNVPVLIAPDDTIICGEARVTAALELGLPKIPTICISHLNERERLAFRIIENKIAEGAEWDIEVLKEQFCELIEADFDLTGLIDSVFLDTVINGDDATTSTEESPREAALPVLRTVAVTGLGDVWGCGDSRVACGDAREGAVYARLLGDEKAQLGLTDPPYGVPIAGHVSGLGKLQHREFAMGSVGMNSTELTEFLRRSCALLAQYSKDGSLHYLFFSHHHMEALMAAANSVYDERKNLVVWVKTNAGMGSLYRSQHELIFVYKHGKAPHVNNVQLGANGRYRTNVLEYAGANTFRAGRNEELARHPTPKPVPLIADLIRDASNVGDIVLDPFVGGSTILIATEKTRRRAFGIELDPIYVDLSVGRWQNYTGKSAILLETGQTFAEVAAERLKPEACEDAARVQGEPS